MVWMRLLIMMSDSLWVDGCVADTQRIPAGPWHILKGSLASIQDTAVEVYIANCSGTCAHRRFTAELVGGRPCHVIHTARALRL